MWLNVGELGADATGRRLCTEVLQEAIDRVAASGGGTVEVPAGRFVTGSFELKARVCLRLGAGAVLQASGNLEDYRTWPYRHEEWGPTVSLVFAQDAEGVVIEGPGVIDLNDEPFFEWSTLKTDANFTPEDAASLDPEQAAEAPVQPRERPNQCMVFLRCDNLTLRNLVIRRAPCWTLTIVESRRVELGSVRIQNHRRTPNSDGVHLCGCDGVTIHGCQFDCGDDCVAITGIASPDTENRNVLVTGCILRSSSAGVRLGHLYSKVRSVRVSDCIIADSNRGLAVFAGRDGFVEDVQIHGVSLSTHLMAGQWWGKGEPMVVCAHDGGCVAGLDVRAVASRADNSVLLCGKGGLVEQVAIVGWTARRFESKNSRRFGDRWDLEPIGFHPIPHAPSRKPWLVAAGVAGFRLEDCFARAEPPLADASVEALLL
ncbi:MAG: glycosyl hydrolase family 28 protein [Fimbriimonadales bacterium]|nr:glycosyl hydrolase family 28 protein [Fimbriimonadales bacterium]